MNRYRDTTNERARGRGRMGACLMIALLAGSALPLLAPMAQAEQAALVPAQLPVPRSSATSAFDGQNMWLFGGSDGSTLQTTLVKVNPVTGVGSSNSVICCTGYYGGGGFFDGTNVWFTGGFGPCTGTFCRNVFKVPIATGQFGQLVDIMPIPRWLHGAIHDGQNAYLFGGRSAGSAADIPLVTKFNTTSLSFTNVANLPYAMEQAATVWTGQHAYVIGGYAPTQPGGGGRDIIRFTPATNAVAVVAQLPRGLVNPSAVWDGLHVYVFGGSALNPNEVVDDVVRFTPSTNEVKVVGDLPKPNSGSNAAWIGHDAYILGGYTLPGGVTRDIVKFSWTAPSAPQNPGASGVVATGAVDLAWQAPAADGGRPVSAYTISRGSTSGSETLLTTIGSQLAFTDTTCPARQACYYTIGAVNVVGEGPQSTEVAVIPPSAPQDLAAAWELLPPGGPIGLSWTAPASAGSSAVAGYAIYRRDGSAPMSLLATVGNVLAYSDDTCPDLQVCYYEVAAFNSHREGPLSKDVYGGGIACFPYSAASAANACVGLRQGANPTAVPGAGTCLIGPACVPDPGLLPVPTGALQGFVEATALCGTLPECRVDLGA